MSFFSQHRITSKPLSTWALVRPAASSLPGPLHGSNNIPVWEHLGWNRGALGPSPPQPVTPGQMPQHWGPSASRFWSLETGRPPGHLPGMGFQAFPGRGPSQQASAMFCPIYKSTPAPGRCPGPWAPGHEATVLRKRGPSLLLPKACGCARSWAGTDDLSPGWAPVCWAENSDVGLHGDTPAQRV